MDFAIKLGYMSIFIYVLMKLENSYALFQSGREDIYEYSTSLVTGSGSRERASFASAINFTGELHIQGEASVLNVQLNNVQFGFYNGDYNKRTNRIQENMKFLFKNMQDIEGIQMQFSYINGIVENLKISEGYPAWSVNILRGIASMLVMRGATRESEAIESDINGECPTKYSKCGNKYIKTKNLTQCTGRPDTTITLKTSLLKCTQTLKNGVLDSAECTERHLIELSPASEVFAFIRNTIKPLNATRSSFKQSKRTALLDSNLLFDLHLLDSNPVQQELLQSLSKLVAKVIERGIPEIQQDLDDILESSVLVSQCITSTECTEQITLLGNFLATLIEPLRNSDFPFLILMHAIGNLPQLTESLITTLADLLDLLISNPERTVGDQRSVIAILDSFRRDPCVPILKQKVSRILSDVSNSPLARIQAYLASIRCLTETDVSGIQTVINTAELTDRVASFIVSHIRSILATSSTDNAKRENANLVSTVELRDFPVLNFTTNRAQVILSAEEDNTDILSTTVIAQNIDALLLKQKSTASFINTAFTVKTFEKSFNLLEIGLWSEEELEDPSDVPLLKSSSSPYTNSNSKLLTSSHGDVYFRLLDVTTNVESFINSKRRVAVDSIVTLVNNAIDALLNTNTEQEVPLGEANFYKNQDTIPTSSGLPIAITIEGLSILSLQISGGPSQNAKGLEESVQTLANILPVSDMDLKRTVTIGGGPMKTGFGIINNIRSAAGIGFSLVNVDGVIQRKTNILNGTLPIFNDEETTFQIEETESRVERKNLQKAFH